MLEVSENTLIPQPLISSKIPPYRFLVFLKYLRFGFLTVTVTALTEYRFINILLNRIRVQSLANYIQDYHKPNKLSMT